MSIQRKKRMPIEVKEFEGVVKRLGNSGYIPAPKNLIGKKVRVTILEEDEE
jgi:putative transposon-encoded protein